MKKNASLIAIFDVNPKLYQIVLSLIKMVQNIHLCVDNNFYHYIEILNEDILAKLEKFILTTPTMDFLTLSTIINLLLNLTSDNFKSILLQSHQADFSTNPEWLHLINHLNERQAIIDLSQSISKHPFNEHFVIMLSLAKRLIFIKQQVSQYLKQVLLNEVGILDSISSSSTFHALLNTKTIKNGRLIKLWLVCAEKFQERYLPVVPQSRYIHFIVKLLLVISYELLDRSKDNPPLLTQFSALFHHIPLIQEAILSTHEENTIPTSSITTFWITVSPANKILQSLFTMIQKTFALQMMHKIEKYVSQKLPSIKMTAFKELCHQTDPKGNIILIKNSIATIFEVKDEMTLLKATMLLQLYTALLKLPQNGQTTLGLPDFFSKALDDAKRNPLFFKSKTFLPLLEELQTLAGKHFTPRHDDDLLWNPSVNKRFSLLLS